MGRSANGCATIWRPAHRLEMRWAATGTHWPPLRRWGPAVDLEEAYRWGWDELHRLEAEMSTVADRVVAGATVPRRSPSSSRAPGGP